MIKYHPILWIHPDLEAATEELLALAVSDTIDAEELLDGVTQLMVASQWLSRE